MTVYFANNEPLDLDFIRLMGVSIKTTDNPIGYFGTGLKYAIATLLRNNQEVELLVNGKSYVFSTRKKVLRGEEIELVFMNDEQLPFSASLGKNWELWQAFRELYSNAKDEGGVILDRPPSVAPEYGTILTVRGDAFDRVYNNRHEIILDSEPLFLGPEVSIHRKGTSTKDLIFYRGIRTVVLQQPSQFFYNIRRTMQLTEDRTFSSAFILSMTLGLFVAQDLTDEELLTSILLPRPDSMEAKLDYSWGNCTPSKTFLDVVGRNKMHPHLSSSALELWRKYRDVAKEEYEIFTLRPDEEELLTQAKMLLDGLDVDLDYGAIKFVKALGPSILGKYRHNTIYISREAFDQGLPILAGTIYEEYLHHEHGFMDESRPFQNFLLNRLITTLIRLQNNSKWSD